MVYKGYEIKRVVWIGNASYTIGIYIEGMLVQVFRTVVDAEEYIDNKTKE